MPQRVTKADLRVVRQTLGNDPRPIRLTKSELRAIRQTLGNDPRPVRLTRSALSLIWQTLGNGPLPLRLTRSGLSVVQSSWGNEPSSIRATSTYITVVASSRATWSEFQVTQLSGSVIIRQEIVVDENRWPPDGVGYLPGIRRVLGPLKIIEVTIPAFGHHSTPVRLEPTDLLVGVWMPASWTPASLGFDVTLDGTEFQPAKAVSRDGNYGFVGLTVEAGRYIVVDPMKIPGIRWFRFRSMDSNGNDVAQSDTRAIKVIAARIA